MGLHYCARHAGFQFYHSLRFLHLFPNDDRVMLPCKLFSNMWCHILHSWKTEYFTDSCSLQSISASPPLPTSDNSQKSHYSTKQTTEQEEDIQQLGNGERTDTNETQKSTCTASDTQTYLSNARSLPSNRHAGQDALPHIIRRTCR